MKRILTGKATMSCIWPWVTELRCKIRSVPTLILFATLCVVTFGRESAAQEPRNLLLEVPEGRFVGLPIHWSPREVALLESSGQIRLFEAEKVVEHQLLDELFQPQDLLQASLELQAEMGSSYETLVTGPYVICAPVGGAKRWETRFRSLLAGYIRYFEVRGWPIRKPDFPLSIIILPNREDFFRLGNQEIGGKAMASNLAGMYVPRTNRCLLYHIDHGGSSTNWQATEATIVHEAIHQLAYNTGAHERLFEHPLWFVEGLATMFEVPAVYDPTVRVSNIESRVHQEKLDAFKALDLDSDKLGAYLQNLVAGDKLFGSQPEAAYALSWALTYYLIERMPTEYYDLVIRQQARGFQPYTAGDREQDFRSAFQMAPHELAPQVLQLLKLR